MLTLMRARERSDVRRGRHAVARGRSVAEAAPLRHAQLILVPRGVHCTRVSHTRPGAGARPSALVRTAPCPRSRTMERIPAVRLPARG